MTPILARAAPLRFLIGVMLCWMLMRVAMLADWSGPGLSRTGPAMIVALRGPQRGSQGVETAMRDETGHRFQPVSRVGSLTIPLSEPTGPVTARADPVEPMAPEAEPSGRRSRRPEEETVAATGTIDATPHATVRPRWSGAAWVFLRGGGRTSALAPVGQIGGGQAGARMLYRLDGRGRLAVSGRISRALGGPRQTEAAIGLDWRPVARLPLHVMAERRIAIDRGGRNAWTLGIAGGVYAVPLAGRWRLDGYGEAGLVGMRRHDPYADGAVRVARAIELGRDMSLTLGGGLWGATQPGAQRMDLGPSVVLRVPVTRRALSVALDWRERVAGRARPGSGAALTVAMDF